MSHPNCPPLSETEDVEHTDFEGWDEISDLRNHYFLTGFMQSYKTQKDRLEQDRKMIQVLIDDCLKMEGKGEKVF